MKRKPLLLPLDVVEEETKEREVHAYFLRQLPGKPALDKWQENGLKISDEAVLCNQEPWSI